MRWTMNVVIGLLVAACGSEDNNNPPATGTGGTVGTGGAPTTGGSPPTGGSKPTGGTVATGGVAPVTGGAAPVTGGTVSTGGTSSPPTGGTIGAGGSGGTSGGAPNGGGGGGPKGGASGAGAGGTSAGAPSGGAGGTGGGSGTCQKGTTKGKEVLFIGESFIQASSIPEETTKLAQAAGSLASGDNYVDKSVSGTWIGNGAGNSIPNQYKNNSSGVRFVLMNGGGNDCWQGGKDSDRANALSAAKSLFQEMGTNKVEKVVYFFYPDPIGSQFANLTACLNLLRPDMKALCDAQTAPKCYWVDLRETWNGHPEYTSDGIHVAGPGNAPTAAAIFKSMQANCVAP
jgi:hypothetical protein